MFEEKGRSSGDILAPKTGQLMWSINFWMCKVWKDGYYSQGLYLTISTPLYLFVFDICNSDHTMRL